jgi:hypothetical protein
MYLSNIAKSNTIQSLNPCIASRVIISGNVFHDVAPRALVLKTGSDLEVSHNVLAVASTLDVFQFSHLTIYCNQEKISDSIPKKCEKTTADQNEHGEEQSAVRLLGIFVTLFGHFWLLVLLVGFFLVSVFRVREIGLHQGLSCEREIWPFELQKISCPSPASARVLSPPCVRLLTRPSRV